MFRFKKHDTKNEETNKQPSVAAHPDTDQLPDELLEYACGYTPEHYTAPAGLFRKPVPEDLI